MNIENIKKKRILDQFLSDDHALIHLDSTKENVVVPASCKNNPVLTLKVSRLFAGRIQLDEEGISTSLKFSGEYFDCFIPWDTIWGISSDKGEQKLWENYFPKATESNVKDEKVESEQGVEMISVESKKDFKSGLRRIK